MRLWEHTSGALAFVSGRPVGDLDLLFSPLRLPTIGGHGAEIRARESTAAQARMTPLPDSVRQKLMRLAAAWPDVLLEDKGYSIALHYRLAAQNGPVVLEAVAAACAQFPPSEIELLRGKCVVEVKRPGTSKGQAVRELMTYPPFAGRRPIFIGDDVTDESVFEVIRDFDGVSFAVGRRRPNVDGYFERPENVRDWLDQVVQDDAGLLP